MQLERIAKLLEQKKSFPPRRDSFQSRNPFNKHEGRDFDRKPRFNDDRDRKPRAAAEGKDFSFKKKRRNRF